MSQTMLAIAGLGTPELIVIVLVIFLLFGATRLPQLAKALGQSKKAFKDGLDEGESAGTNSRGKLNSIEDEELFEEARRRAQQMRAEGSKKIEH